MTTSSPNLKSLKFIFLILTCLLVLACPSDDECTKTITIPQLYIIGNQSYTYDIEQEVSCDFPEPTEPELIEAPVLENFTYQVLSYNYIPYSDNNTTILQYEIQLNNHNDFAVTGLPKMTFYDGHIEVSGYFTEDAIEPCHNIEANSSCILTFDKEYPIEQILPVETYEIVNVEYFLIY